MPLLFKGLSNEDYIFLKAKIGNEKIMNDQKVKSN